MHPRRSRSACRPFVAAATLALTLLAACGGGDGGTDPGSIVEAVSVSAARNTPLAPGDSVLVTAVPRNASGFPVPGRAITWSSANDAVATVSPRTDSTAMVVGMSVGSVEIRAAVGSVTGRRTIVVSTPTPARRIVAVAAGAAHTCALDSDGGAWCWGDNNQGQLGDGTDQARRVPTAVQGAHVFRSIAAGWLHSCALDEAGAAWCWGLGDGGALGDSSGAIRRSPVAVRGGLTFSRIAAGRQFTCGITTAGAAYCWGSSSFGTLGNGDAINAKTYPVPVSGGITFRELSVGSLHTCGLATDGRVHCWGSNFAGKLGDASTTDRHVPVVAAGGETFDGVSAGVLHTCAWRASGTMCWGSNEDGQFGNGGSGTSATAVAGPADAFALVSSGVQSRGACAIRAADGEGVCWGLMPTAAASSGVLRQPAPVMGTTRWSALSFGPQHGCGIATNGTLLCWGVWTLRGNGDEVLPEVPATPVIFP